MTGHTATTTLKIRRIRALADMLNILPEKYYDPRRWGNGTNPHLEGFIGCAAGHAVKLFSHLGFVLVFAQAGFVVRYHDREGIDAVMELLGIDNKTAYMIFGGAGSTPKIIAVKLRSLLDGENTAV